MATRIAASLRELNATPGQKLFNYLLEGRANPEDHPIKLITALLRMPGSESEEIETRALALNFVLEEWLAQLVQLHYGKRSLKPDVAYLQDLACYIPLDDLLGVRFDLDPLASLHPLELGDDAAVSAFTSDWEARAVGRVADMQPVSEIFKSRADALSGLLPNSRPKAFPTIEVEWPGWKTQFFMHACATFASPAEGAVSVTDG